MGIVTEKYVRKPLYVDAVRVTEQNFDEMVSWCNGTVEVDNVKKKKFIRVRVATPKVPKQTMAYVGDWILWNEFGGFKIYTDRSFRAAFDPVVSEEETVLTPQGEQVEFVEATPQAIADVVNEQQPRVAVEEGVQVEDSPTAPPAQDVGGKRVLSVLEQQQMTSEDVRELVRSGEVILEQDLAA